MPLNNFDQVASILSGGGKEYKLFRAAQPDARAIDTLQKMCGSLIVIKLNGENEFKASIEAAFLPGLEVRSFSVDQFSPTLEQAELLAKEVSNALLQNNVLVHCTHGRDRTGFVIGAWLIMYGKMNIKDVLNYRDEFGMTVITKLADEAMMDVLEQLHEKYKGI